MIKFTDWFVQREATETKSYSVKCSRCGRHMGWSEKPDETAVCPKCYNTKDLALSPGAGNKPTAK